MPFGPTVKPDADAFAKKHSSENSSDTENASPNSPERGKVRRRRPARALVRTPFNREEYPRPARRKSATKRGRNTEEEMSELEMSDRYKASKLTFVDRKFSTSWRRLQGSMELTSDSEGSSAAEGLSAAEMPFQDVGEDAGEYSVEIAAALDRSMLIGTPADSAPEDREGARTDSDKMMRSSKASAQAFFSEETSHSAPEAVGADHPVSTFEPIPGFRR